MLIYSHNGTEAGVGSTFYSRRPFSYQNDMYAYAYWMTNLYLQHTFKLGGKMPPVTARFDIYNLLNCKLMGTIGTNGFPFNRDKGYSFGTMQRQAPRQAMFTLGGEFLTSSYSDPICAHDTPSRTHDGTMMGWGVIFWGR
ncbi:MAG: hypothetical protein AAYR33_01845 [Acetobacteraceae bacterium]